MNERTSVLIGVPYYKEMNLQSVAQIMAWKDREDEFNMDFRFCCTKGHPIGFNREILASHFMKTGAEWMISFDTDVVPCKDFPLMIREAEELGQKLVSGAVLIWRRGQKELVVNFRDPSEDNAKKILTAFSDQECIPVDHFGTGCYIVHRDVFLGSERPWYQDVYSYPEDKTQRPEKLLGEDYYFTYHCKQAGFQPWFNPKYKNIHHVTVPLDFGEEAKQQSTEEKG